MSDTPPKPKLLVPPELPRTQLLVGGQPYVEFMVENGFKGRLWRGSAPQLPPGRLEAKLAVCMDIMRTDKAFTAEIEKAVSAESKAALLAESPPAEPTC